MFTFTSVLIAFLHRDHKKSSNTDKRNIRLYDISHRNRPYYRLLLTAAYFFQVAFGFDDDSASGREGAVL